MRYKTSVLNDMQSKIKIKRRPRFNTSKHERKAIGTLKKNTEIIIKPADKGGAIVIMEQNRLYQGRGKTTTTTTTLQETG